MNNMSTTLCEWWRPFPALSYSTQLPVCKLMEINLCYTFLHWIFFITLLLKRIVYVYIITPKQHAVNKSNTNNWAVKQPPLWFKHPRDQSFQTVSCEVFSFSHSRRPKLTSAIPRWRSLPPNRLDKREKKKEKKAVYIEVSMYSRLSIFQRTQ